MQESFFEFLQRSGEGLDVLVADIGAELEEDCKELRLSRMEAGLGDD